MTTDQSTGLQLAPAHIISIFLAVVILWVLAPLFIHFLLGDIASNPQAGHLFSSVNALFSGLAFAGVIIAVLLQREELALQRRELQHAREELRRSANAQDATHAALSYTLYAHTLKMAIDILEEPEVVKARRLVAEYGHTYDEHARKFGGATVQAAAETVSRTFEAVGALVRKRLLPAEYITDTWSHPIVRSWTNLRQFNLDLREDRKDPFVAQDFEFLAELAMAHLEKTGAPVDPAEPRYLRPKG